MTSKQASVLLNDGSIGVPDNDLVCVVELKGLRVVASNPAVPPEKRVAQFAKTYLVLDAQSGNALLEGHS
ncbi:hypothetical protein KDW_63970 [Dictyobacter vulcani]|uniref:Uncharacterized protein n=1 Tax=Dictyobacter vulcani TaxID=2607529 RepID=A0A5J4KW84_9CHLR|nr:hypothetical protein [Dictyobacter vulcani]GER92235.1 hypothetical protein KDW_63970 [Dictyobacter vulcani]